MKKSHECFDEKTIQSISGAIDRIYKYISPIFKGNNKKE